MAARIDRNTLDCEWTDVFIYVPLKYTLKNEFLSCCCYICKIILQNKEFKHVSVVKRTTVQLQSMDNRIK